MEQLYGYDLFDDFDELWGDPYCFSTPWGEGCERQFFGDDEWDDDGDEYSDDEEDEEWDDDDLDDFPDYGPKSYDPPYDELDSEWLARYIRPMEN